VALETCQHCGNEQPWYLARVSTWFTLFFIPVFPYSVKRLYICPICQSHYEITPDQYEAMRPIAEANQRLQEGKITNQQHRQVMFENRKRIG